MRALVELGIPLFIFATTACRYIGDQCDTPKKHLDIILWYQTRNQVSKLDGSYVSIPNRLFDDEDGAHKQRRTREFQDILVGSIGVSESPLSITSLARLPEIPRKDVRLTAPHP